MDHRRATPAELRPALNSFSDLGTVCTAPRLRQIRADGGKRVGDGRNFDLFKLGGFLVGAWKRAKDSKVDRDASAAERNRARATERKNRETAAAQEVRIELCRDPLLRESMRYDLARYCRRVHPKRFGLPFSPDHLRVIEKYQRAILEGGRGCTAMPRGSGKTTIADTALEWAVLYGHRRYPVLISASSEMAKKRLAVLRVSLMENKTLRTLFPEVVEPIIAAKGENKRTVRLNGEAIYFKFGSTQLILPYLPQLGAMGAVVETAGIEGGFLGLNDPLPSGETIRPDIVFVDDPQTSKTAKNALTCAERERVINADIAGLGGPGTTLSIVIQCTVKRPGDLSDRILRNRQWDPERCKSVYKWPGEQGRKLWEKYELIKLEGEGDQYERQAEATQLVRDNFEIMHAGASVGWPERFDPETQVSALQAAYDLKIADDEGFASEYQNEPLSDDRFGVTLDESDIVAKLSGLERGRVPYWADMMTAGVDIQGDCLFWTVVAWKRDTFSGNVVDYGTFPDQSTRIFRKSRLPDTLAHAFPHIDNREDRIREGLRLLIKRLFREYQREDGVEGFLTVDRCAIDANWFETTELVYQFCRNNPLPVTPSHGQGITAGKRPLSQYKVDDKTLRNGVEWRYMRNEKRGYAPELIVDSNYWKTWLVNRLAQSLGSRGSLELFGDDPATHALLAAHIKSEYRIPTSGYGRQVDEWKLPPDKPDNDWLDCLVYASCAASLEGAMLSGEKSLRDKRREESKPKDTRPLAERAKNGRRLGKPRRLS